MKIFRGKSLILYFIFSDFQSKNIGNPAEYNSVPFVKKEAFDLDSSNEKKLKSELDVNSENCGNIYSNVNVKEEVSQ